MNVFLFFLFAIFPWYFCPARKKAFITKGNDSIILLYAMILLQESRGLHARYTLSASIL